MARDDAKIRKLSEQYEALRSEHEALVNDAYEDNATPARLLELQNKMSSLVLEIIDATRE